MSVDLLMAETSRYVMPSLYSRLCAAVTRFACAVFFFPLGPPIEPKCGAPIRPNEATCRA